MGARLTLLSDSIKLMFLCVPLLCLMDNVEPHKAAFDSFLEHYEDDVNLELDTNEETVQTPLDIATGKVTKAPLYSCQIVSFCEHTRFPQRHAAVCLMIVWLVWLLTASATVDLP